MAPRIQFVPLYLLFTTINLYYVVEQSTALTINLTHRYAPESPFYKANLTHQETIERLRFRTRVGLINSIGRENESLEAIRPTLEFEHAISAFLVQVSLGTFISGGSIHKSYYLDLDTGSDIVWLQCQDCTKDQHHCYPQTEPPFPYSKSDSYKPLPCGRHPLCFPNECIKDSCSYRIMYVDDSHSIGILAHENFTFPSSSGHGEIVRLVFGCGMHNKRPYKHDQDLKMAGIFGLGWGPHSFVTQLHSITLGRFSYCFPSASQVARGMSVFLRFGSDIPSYSSLPNTRILEYDDDSAYYVNLLDMSIDGVRVNIPSKYFKKRGPNVGGCYFDTGTTMTRISQLAYRIFKQAMEIHIAQSDASLEKVDHMDGYDLCYRRSTTPTGHNELPSVTFHFEGNADFVVRAENAFYHTYDDNFPYEYICLDMFPSSDQGRTTIGSETQTNQFIVYDLPARRQYFAHRDCSRYQ